MGTLSICKKGIAMPIKGAAFLPFFSLNTFWMRAQFQSFDEFYFCLFHCYSPFPTATAAAGTSG